MMDQDKSKEELIAELEALHRENTGLKNKLSQTKESSGKLTGKTILVVDDNDNTRQVVAAMLENLGCDVIEAPSPGQALEAFADNQGGIDLVLSDIVMPGGGGADMAAQMKELNPELKVVFMSGYAEDEIVHDEVFKIQHSEKAVFIKKPFSPGKIENLIQKQFIS